MKSEYHTSLAYHFLSRGLYSLNAIKIPYFGKIYRQFCSQPTLPLDKIPILCLGTSKSAYIINHTSQCFNLIRLERILKRYTGTQFCVSFQRSSKACFNGCWMVKTEKFLTNFIKTVSLQFVQSTENSWTQTSQQT